MCRSEMKCSNAPRPNDPTNRPPTPPPAEPGSLDTPPPTVPPAGRPPSDPPPSGGSPGAQPLRPHSEEWLVFRESFLLYFEPEKRDTFRELGDVLFTKILSGDRYWPEEPWTHARLRTLVLDLLFVVQLLEEIAREPLDSHPEDEDENRLAREAVGWAGELRRVARTMEEAVDAWKGEG